MTRSDTSDGAMAFTYTNLEKPSLEEWAKLLEQPSKEEIEKTHGTWLKAFLQACEGLGDGPLPTPFENFRKNTVSLYLDMQEGNGDHKAVGEHAAVKGGVCFFTSPEPSYPSLVHKIVSLAASCDPSVQQLVHAVFSYAGRVVLATLLVPLTRESSKRPYRSPHTMPYSLGAAEAAGDTYLALDGTSIFIPVPVVADSRLDLIKHLSPTESEPNNTFYTEAAVQVLNSTELTTPSNVRHRCKSHGVSIRRMGCLCTAEGSDVVTAELVSQVMKKVARSSLGCDAPANGLNRVFHHALSPGDWENLVVPLLCKYYDVSASVFTKTPTKTMHTTIAQRLCKLLGTTISSGKVADTFTPTTPRFTGPSYTTDVKMLKRRVENSRQSSDKSALLPLTGTLTHVLHLTPDTADALQHEADVLFFMSDLLKMQLTVADLLRTSALLDKHDALQYLKQAVDMVSGTRSGPWELTEKLLALRSYSATYLSVKGDHHFNEVKTHLLQAHQLWRDCLAQGFLHESWSCAEGALITQCLSKGHQALEEYESALPFSKEAKKLVIMLKGDTSEDLAVAATELGHAKMSLGNMDSAAEEFRMAVDIYSKIYGDNHIYTATALNNLACLEYNTARKAARMRGAKLKDFAPLCELAKASFTRIVTMPMEMLNSAGGDESVLVNALTSLANVELLLGNVQEALPICLRSIDEGKRLFDEGHPDVVAAKRTLTNINGRKRILASIKIQAYVRSYQTRKTVNKRKYGFRAVAAVVSVVSHTQQLLIASSLLCKASRGLASRLALSLASHQARAREAATIQRCGRGYTSRLLLQQETQKKIGETIARSTAVLQKTGRGMAGRIAAKCMKTHAEEEAKEEETPEEEVQEGLEEKETEEVKEEPDDEPQAVSPEEEPAPAQPEEEPAKLEEEPTPAQPEEEPEKPEEEPIPLVEEPEEEPTLLEEEPVQPEEEPAQPEEEPAKLEEEPAPAQPEEEPAKLEEPKEEPQPEEEPAKPKEEAAQPKEEPAQPEEEPVQPEEEQHEVNKPEEEEPKEIESPPVVEPPKEEVTVQEEPPKEEMEPPQVKEEPPSTEPEPEPEEEEPPMKEEEPQKMEPEPEEPPVVEESPVEKELKAEPEVENVITVQRVGKGHTARVAVQSQRHHTAATKLQAVQRGRAGRGSVAALQERMRHATEVLHRTALGHRARKAMLLLRKVEPDKKIDEATAAREIQRVYRGHASRTETQSALSARKNVYTKKETDIVTLQYEYDREQVACRRIQACHKGHGSRRWMRRQKAAVVIQKNVRGHQTRQDTTKGWRDTRREKDQKAKTIQKEYLRHTGNEEEERCLREGAAIVIQSHWKGAVMRDAYKRDKEHLKVEMARRRMLRERKERKDRILRETTELQDRIATNSKKGGAVVSIFLPRVPVKTHCLSPLKSPGHPRSPLPDISLPQHPPLYTHYHAATIRDIKKRASKVALGRLMHRTPSPLPWVSKAPTPVR